MSKTEMKVGWTPGLENRVAGDWIWLEIERYSGGRERELRQVQHVDRNGRLYISAKSLWGKWRYGFKSDTGTALEYRQYTMLDATPDEVAAELQNRAILADQKKEEEHAADLERRQKSKAPELAAMVEGFVAICINTCDCTECGPCRLRVEAEKLLAEVGGASFTVTNSK